MSRHYLSDQHQQCIIVFIQKAFPQLFDRHVSASQSEVHSEHIQQRLTPFFEKMDSTMQEIDQIVENCARLSSEREAFKTKLKEQRDHILKLKELSDNGAKTMESLHQIVKNMEKIIDELKTRSISGPKLISSNGTYTWKVNFRSINDNGQTIVSEPFYTSQSGYKMALTCGINVDNESQKQYASISFIILCGEFDSILRWPLQFPINLMILDLSGKKRDIVHTVLPNTQKMEFVKPSSDKNTTFHITQFCAADTLLEPSHGYMQDNFMLVQIYINFMAPCVMLSSNEVLKTADDPIQRTILNVPEN